MKVRAGEKLVFIGDSNTDAEHRTRFPPHGRGYVMFVAAMLAARHPELRVEVVNRGNDGDTVVDLARRWQTDVIDLAPDWLFVLIGTNDVAYRFLPGNLDRAVDDDAYADTLADLVADARQRTKARVVLIEPMPFEIPPGIPEEPNRALARLCVRIAQVANEHDCEIVRVHAALAAIMANGLATGWYENFIHPAFPGHAFIAQQILRHLGWQL